MIRSPKPPPMEAEPNEAEPNEAEPNEADQLIRLYKSRAKVLSAARSAYSIVREAMNSNFGGWYDDELGDVLTILDGLLHKEALQLVEDLAKSEETT